MEKAASGSITLSNGVIMPTVGIGTYQASGSTLYDCLTAAIVQGGVRHIDTARIYKNEAVVADAMRDANMTGQVFITSKLSPYEQGTEKATAACEASLATLGDPLDCMLIHWPGASGHAQDDPNNAVLRLQTWRVLESFYKAGRFRSIGVSNYTVRHIEELCAVAEIPPMINQVELHPCYPQTQLRATCAAHNIAIVSYSTLGRGVLLTHPTVLQVAAECRRSPAQVLLRWALQLGVGVIPKSARVERVLQQGPDALLGWELDACVMEKLNGMENGTKYCWCPDAIV